MAKAKKTSKKASAKTESNASTDQSGINTDQAAQAAAAFLANRVKQNQATNKPESVDFKKLKAGLLKPASTGPASLLGGVQSSKTQGSSHFTKQVGHNQTIGANHSRTGVPRRTSGG